MLEVVSMKKIILIIPAYNEEENFISNDLAFEMENLGI